MQLLCSLVAKYVNGWTIAQIAGKWHKLLRKKAAVSSPKNNHVVAEENE